MAYLEKKVYKVGFELSEILSVYSGIPGRCMCGCSGTYRYASAHRKTAGKDRGYKVDDEEISDRRVKTVFNKMVKNAHLGIEVIDNYIFTIEIGSRQYTIYLKEK